MSQKVNRLVNTPGASRKLLTDVPQHDDSLNSQQATKKAAMGKKQKKLLKKRVEKARLIVGNQQQKLKVIFISNIFYFASLVTKELFFYTVWAKGNNFTLPVLCSWLNFEEKNTASLLCDPNVWGKGESVNCFLERARSTPTPLNHIMHSYRTPYYPEMQFKGTVS